jgi:hypothetical protein
MKLKTHLVLFILNSTFFQIKILFALILMLYLYFINLFCLLIFQKINLFLSEFLLLIQ